MPRKPKFKPVITRVKLNPEQAVLSCSCYAWTAIAHWGPGYSPPAFHGQVVCQGPGGRGIVVGAWWKAAANNS